LSEYQSFITSYEKLNAEAVLMMPVVLGDVNVHVCVQIETCSTDAVHDWYC